MSETTSRERVGQHTPAYPFFAWFAVAAHGAFSCVLAVMFTVIWMFGDHQREFWPAYVMCCQGWLLLAHTLATRAIHGPVDPGSAHRPLRVYRTAKRRLGFELNASVLLPAIGFFWGISAAAAEHTNVTPPWALWPTTAIAFVLAFHALLAFVFDRNERYQRRITQLTTTRSGVLEAQELELRRIERDLHDGAQARLVALNMQLGLAQQQLDRSPDAVRMLLQEAQGTTRDALRELRDLARGIHPPVLTDRGLVAAIESLVSATPIDVIIDGNTPERLPAAIEAALYFLAAEALTNATKHARCHHVTIALRRGTFDVSLIITDDGEGGADPSGAGLRGIRQRIEALDGHFEISSPPGGPTTLRAELPCAS